MQSGKQDTLRTTGLAARKTGHAVWQGLHTGRQAEHPLSKTGETHWQAGGLYTQAGRTRVRQPGHTVRRTGQNQVGHMYKQADKNIEANRSHGLGQAGRQLCMYTMPYAQYS